MAQGMPVPATINQRHQGFVTMEGCLAGQGLKVHSRFPHFGRGPAIVLMLNIHHGTKRSTHSYILRMNPNVTVEHEKKTGNASS